MYKLGLIGTPLTHSFSKEYFVEKFAKDNDDIFSYHLYDLKKIHHINRIYDPKLVGLNVTRPYKKKIIKYLDKLDVLAQNTQSVNTIFINPKNKQKTGYNTDIIGFKKLFNQLYIKKDMQALILGSGGASNTVSYVLHEKNIKHKIVSRKPTNNMLSYKDLNNVFSDFNLIINTTPLGQYPNINSQPKIPYHLISTRYQCIDLIYNPKKTLFLQKSEAKGAKIINGIKMLSAQAEASFLIWTDSLKKI